VGLSGQHWDRLANGGSPRERDFHRVSSKYRDLSARHDSSRRVLEDNKPTPTVPHNNGEGSFQDVTNPSGMAGSTFAFSGWSTHLFDYDNDGWKDLRCAGACDGHH